MSEIILGALLGTGWFGWIQWLEAARRRRWFERDAKDWQERYFALLSRIPDVLEVPND